MQETDAGENTEIGRIVLVGTYKGDQLTKWRGWYNYPISDKDKINPEDFAKINELWLFQGTSGQKTYKAEFVGVKTREELIRDYGYPAKGKAHGDKYLLFKIEFKYQHKGALRGDGHDLRQGFGRCPLLPLPGGLSRAGRRDGNPLGGRFHRNRLRHRQSHSA